MDINEALAALSRTTERKVVELRGEKGEKGDRGDVGPSGRDAAEVQLKIGKVLTAKPDEDAQARIRRDTDGTFCLDIAVPRGAAGERGPKGLVTEGPQGTAGVDGKTPKIAIGRVVSGDEPNAKIREGIDGVSYIDFVLPRGERGEPGVGLIGPPGPMGRGESIVGPQGEPGRSVDTEMLKATLIEVLSDVGVLNETMRKMIAVKAEIKRCLHQATSRHQAELAEVYRRIDNIIG